MQRTIIPSGSNHTNNALERSEKESNTLQKLWQAWRQERNHALLGQALRNEKGFGRSSSSCAQPMGKSTERGRRPRIESICSQTQHKPQSSCQATLQSPVKPTRRTTSTLGCQFLVIVTLAGAVPCRPQPGPLQTYPVPPKAVAQVPHPLEGHVPENLLPLSTSKNHTRSSLG